MTNNDIKCIEKRKIKPCRLANMMYDSSYILIQVLHVYTELSDAKASSGGSTKKSRELRTRTNAVKRKSDLQG